MGAKLNIAGWICEQMGGVRYDFVPLILNDFVRMMVVGQHFQSSMGLSFWVHSIDPDWPALADFNLSF